MSEAAPLEIRNLEHAYSPGKPVLRGVSLTIARGELVAVLGVSGSGKSTLLRSVAGFVTPNSGEVFINGVKVTAAGRSLVPPEKRGVGMVFQDYALFPHMTVAQNIAFGIPDHSNPAPVIHELLDLVGLRGMESRKPSTLSGGQQQRVALARALAPSPKLLVLDEPFANLDGSLRFEISGEIQRILQERDVSALLVTHERTEALGLASKVLILDEQGKQGGATVVQFGTPEEVYHQPRTRGVAGLTGAYNTLEGACRGETADTLLGPVSLRTPTEGPATLVLRPEGLELDGPGDHRVLRSRFHGVGYHLDIETPAGCLLVYHEGTAPRSGTGVQVRITGRASAIQGNEHENHAH